MLWDYYLEIAYGLNNMHWIRLLEEQDIVFVLLDNSI